MKGQATVELIGMLLEHRDYVKELADLSNAPELDVGFGPMGLKLLDVVLSLCGVPDDGWKPTDSGAVYTRVALVDAYFAAKTPEDLMQAVRGELSRMARAGWFYNGELNEGQFPFQGYKEEPLQ